MIYIRTHTYSDGATIKVQAGTAGAFVVRLGQDVDVSMDRDDLKVLGDAIAGALIESP